MGVEARYKLSNRVEGDVVDDRAKRKSNENYKVHKSKNTYMRMCV